MHFFSCACRGGRAHRSRPFLCSVCLQCWPQADVSVVRCGNPLSRERERLQDASLSPKTLRPFRVSVCCVSVVSICKKVTPKSTVTDKKKKHSTTGFCFMLHHHHHRHHPTGECRKVNKQKQRGEINIWRSSQTAITKRNSETHINTDCRSVDVEK